MFFIAVMLCAFSLAIGGNVSINASEAVDEVQVQSFNDCWGSSLLSHNHTFACGYCSWYTINIGSSSSSAASIRIQELDASGNVIKDEMVNIPANGSYTYTDSNPSSNLRAIRVNTPSYYLEVCVATLN